MTHMHRMLLLGLLLVLFFSQVPVVHAYEDVEVEEHDELEEEEEAEVPRFEDTNYPGSEAYRRLPFHTETIFPSAHIRNGIPSFHAGSKAHAVIGYRNQGTAGLDHIAIAVTGYLQHIHSFDSMLQNFSLVRQGRRVGATETSTFHYVFTPDVHLEPGMYNLVLGMFLQEGNSSYFATAHNATINVDEVAGTDPRTILTYLTLLLFVGAIGYWTLLKLGILKMLSRRNRSASADARRRVEVGTSGMGYDPDYVSKEHLRYREQVLRQASSSPKARQASPKKTQ